MSNLSTLRTYLMTSFSSIWEVNSIGSNVDGSKLVLSLLSTVGPALAGATILPGGSSEQMQAGIGSAGITFFFFKAGRRASGPVCNSSYNSKLLPIREPRDCGSPLNIPACFIIVKCKDCRSRWRCTGSHSLTPPPQRTTSCQPQCQLTISSSHIASLPSAAGIPQSRKEAWQPQSGKNCRSFLQMSKPTLSLHALQCLASPNSLVCHPAVSQRSSSPDCFTRIFPEHFHVTTGIQWGKRNKKAPFWSIV